MNKRFRTVILGLFWGLLLSVIAFIPATSAQRQVIGLIWLGIVLVFAVAVYFGLPRKAELKLRIEMIHNGPIEVDFNSIDSAPQIHIGNLSISADYPSGRPHRTFIGEFSLSPRVPDGLEGDEAQLLQLESTTIEAENTSLIPILLNFNAITDYHQSGTPTETHHEISLEAKGSFTQAKTAEATANTTVQVRLIPQKITNELRARAFRLE